MLWALEFPFRGTRIIKHHQCLSSECVWKPIKSKQLKKKYLGQMLSDDLLWNQGIMKNPIPKCQALLSATYPVSIFGCLNIGSSCSVTSSLEWRKWWPHSKLQTVRGHTHLSPLWAFMCLHIKHSWLLVRGLLCLLGAGRLSLALVPRNNAVGGVAGGRSYAFSDSSPTGSSGAVAWMFFDVLIYQHDKESNKNKKHIEWKSLLL